MKILIFSKALYYDFSPNKPKFSPKIIIGFLAFLKFLQKVCLPNIICIKVSKVKPKLFIGKVKSTLLPIYAILKLPFFNLFIK